MLNRTRLSSLDAFGLRDQRNRIYPALEASDGSTLSLDFTQMSSLDSRFTFSRSTPATFINSQGLVQYADSNMFTGSELLQPTVYGWGAQNNATYAFDTTIADPNGNFGVPKLIASAASGSSAINSSSLSVSGGLTYTLTFYVRAGDGSTASATSLLVGLYESSSSAFAPATGTILSGNGSISGGGAIAITGLTSSWTKVRIYITPTTTASGRGVSFYPDNAAANGKHVYVWGAQFNIGQIANPGYFKTVATAYQAPRFDYNPTTLTPLGLLIEGSATNLVTNSQNITTGTWTVGNNTTLTANTTEVTDPAGGNTATKIAINAGVYGYRAQVVTVLANTAYTFSFWIRGNAGSTQRIYESGGGDLVSQTTLTYTNTDWTRVQVQFTTASITTIFVYVCSKSTSVGSSDVLYVWGAQLETGSVASSYIPTGTSQVARTAESCTMTGTNFSSWYGSPTASSVLFEGTIQQAATGYRRILLLTSDSSGPNTGYPNYNLGVAGGYSTSNTPFMNAQVSVANDVDIYVPSSAAVTNGTKFRIAARAQSGSYRISRAGQSTTSTYSTGTGYPAGLITLGFVANGAAMTSQWISRLIYYPFGISNSQMDEWSA
jgi:hypothetical protein